MNLSFARAVQRSILDHSRPFDMDRWDTCIAGHCRLVCTGGTYIPLSLGPYISLLREASILLDITDDEALGLFVRYDLNLSTSRAHAVFMLEKLIFEQEGEATGSGGAAHSRSPRLKHQHQEQEQKQEELEPVLV